MLPFTAASANGSAPSVKIRFQPGKYTGYSVMHCHSLHHEDEGCMKVVVWQCPGYNATETQPAICTGFKPPVPGTFKTARPAPAPGVLPAAPGPTAPASAARGAMHAVGVMAALASAAAAVAA